MNFLNKNGEEVKDSHFSQMHLLEGERTVDFHSEQVVYLLV